MEVDVILVWRIANIEEMFRNCYLHYLIFDAKKCKPTQIEIFASIVKYIWTIVVNMTFTGIINDFEHDMYDKT